MSDFRVALALDPHPCLLEFLSLRSAPVTPPTYFSFLPCFPQWHLVIILPSLLPFAFSFLCHNLTFSFFSSDPSLISSQSDSSVLRSDHHTAHTPLTIHSNRDNSSLSISQSSTSPTVRTPQSQFFYMDSPQVKDDHPLHQPSISPVSAQNRPSITDEDSQAAPSAGMTPLEVDPQIIEALKGKDRIYVLKLGETFEALITERRCVFLIFFGVVFLSPRCPMKAVRLFFQ